MRFLVACLGAPIITFALLLFMAGLINQPALQDQQKHENPYFDLVINTKDESYASRKRHKPVPPEPKLEPKPEPIVEQTALVKNQVNSPQMDIDFEMPSLDLSSNISAMPMSMPGIESVNAPIAGVTGDAMAMPLYRVQPRYPRKALRLGKQGYVILSFDINESGRVINIKVVKSEPRRLFEKEAERALKQWKYKPMLVNGEAKRQLGQRIRLDFKMDN